MFCSIFARSGLRLTTYRQALALAPGNPNALTSQAFALLELGRYGDALSSSEQALAADPRHDNAFLVRGHALSKLNRPAEAAASYEQALAIDRDQRFALGAMVMAHRAACNWDRLHDLLPMLEQSDRRGRGCCAALELARTSARTRPSIAMRQEFCSAKSRSGTRSRFNIGRGVMVGRIKLAYVSGDFREHPVAYLISELFEKHDRNRFEVIAISYGSG